MGPRIGALHGSPELFREQDGDLIASRFGEPLRVPLDDRSVGR